jgi:hypothetical protein
MSAELFATWAKGFSGCDGGDIGSPAARSTWVCGIEWGGGAKPEEWEPSLSEDVGDPPPGHDDAEHNLRYIFNWQTVKLLTAIDGGKVGDYRKTAAAVRPFPNDLLNYKMEKFGKAARKAAKTKATSAAAKRAK